MTSNENIETTTVIETEKKHRIKGALSITGRGFKKASVKVYHASPADLVHVTVLGSKALGHAVSKVRNVKDVRVVMVKGIEVGDPEA